MVLRKAKTKKKIFFKWQNYIAQWTKKKKTQIAKILNENRDITMDSTEIERIIRLYAKKLDNLDEMNKFLESQNLWRKVMPGQCG